jgi:uncharacterized membrane protein
MPLSKYFSIESVFVWVFIDPPSYKKMRIFSELFLVLRAVVKVLSKMLSRNIFFSLL